MQQQGDVAWRSSSMSITGMRVALVFGGRLGSFEGKLSESQGPTDAVLNVSAYCWRHALLNAHVPGQHVDVFVHSWNYDMAQQIIQALRPTRALFEEQIIFGGGRC